MKKKILSALLATVILAAGYVPATAADDKAVIYVSPNGSDSAKGTIEAPLKTFAGAQAAVRKLKSG